MRFTNLRFRCARRCVALHYPQSMNVRRHINPTLAARMAAIASPAIPTTTIRLYRCTRLVAPRGEAAAAASARARGRIV